METECGDCLRAEIPALEIITEQCGNRDWFLAC